MGYIVFALAVTLTLLMFTFLPNNAVAESEWQVYEVNHNGQIFKIPYKITNGEVKKIEVAREGGAMLLVLQSNPNADGSVEIAIPRNLADPQSSGEDKFAVLVDGDEQYEYKEVNKSPCFRMLLIPFHSGSKEIEIIEALVKLATSQNMPIKSNMTVFTEVPPIYITADKNSYITGELIKISGCTNLGLDDKGVILEVLNPHGRIYKTTTVAPNVDGTFSTSFPLEGDLATNGTYTVKASYAGQSATSSFVVPEFSFFVMIIFASALSLIVATRLLQKPWTLH